MFVQYLNAYPLVVLSVSSLWIANIHYKHNPENKTALESLKSYIEKLSTNTAQISWKDFCFLIFSVERKKYNITKLMNKKRILIFF